MMAARIFSQRMFERHKIVTSISGSVIGHMLLLITVFLVLMADRKLDPKTSRGDLPKEPKEVTIMMSDLMEQIAPKVAPQPAERASGKKFVDTESNVPSRTKPKSADFESDRNTVAATELPPDPDSPRLAGLTSRGDEQIRSMELQERNSSDGQESEPGSKLGAKRKLQEESKFYTDPDSSAKDRVQPGESPDSNRVDRVDETGSTTAVFSIPKRRNMVNGTLTNKGKNAVNAEETPLGRYKKAVVDAVAARWHQNRKENSENVTWGTLRLKFRVSPAGKVTNLEVTENKGNEALLSLTLRSISESKLPAMPDDVAAILGASGLAMNYDVIIY